MEHLSRVFVLGDSISMQYGPYLEKCLTNHLHYARKTGEAEAQLNLDVPQGANGGDSSRVLQYLQALHRAGLLQTDVLVINCGLHDIKTDPATGEKQVAIDAYRQNLRDIVALAKAMDQELVWISTTPCDDSTHNQRQIQFHRFLADIIAYNDAAETIMRKADVPVIDLFTLTNRLGPDLYCDHVHFREPIRQIQGAYIAGWLIGRFGRGAQANVGRSDGTAKKQIEAKR